MTSLNLSAKDVVKSMKIFKETDGPSVPFGPFYGLWEELSTSSPTSASALFV